MEKTTKSMDLEPVETVGFTYRLKKWFKNNPDIIIIITILGILFVMFMFQG